MDRLKKKIDTTLEKDIQLKTRGVFRPITRQIGNSLADIKDFYDDRSEEGVTVVPSECPPHLKHYKVCLLHHLKAGSFLFQNNIVTGTEAAQPLLILMDSLALAMDLEVVARPSDVVCDVLLAVCNQPVIVLTLVDGKRKSDTINEYNTSVAREVTGKLKTFMDERVCVVSGVCCFEDIEKPNIFYDTLKKHAQRSSIFIPMKTFETPLSKLNNIVTAIWASVAETHSVKNEDIKRFLTVEQCVVLLENINKKEVKVYHKPGSGATTLMLEVARRLSRLDRTKLVWNEDEDRRKCSVKVDHKPGSGATTLMLEVARRLSRLDRTKLVWNEDEDRRKCVLHPSIITSKELPTSDQMTPIFVVVEADTEEVMQRKRCWQFVPLKEDEKDPNDSSEVEYSHTKRASHPQDREQNPDAEDQARIAENVLDGTLNAAARSAPPEVAQSSSSPAPLPDLGMGGSRLPLMRENSPDLPVEGAAAPVAEIPVEVSPPQAPVENIPAEEVRVPVPQNEGQGARPVHENVQAEREENVKLKKFSSTPPPEAMKMESSDQDSVFSFDSDDGCEICETISRNIDELPIPRTRYMVTHMSGNVFPHRSEKVAQQRLRLKLKCLVSALKNSGGGVVLVHIDRLADFEGFLDKFHLLFDPSLDELLEDGSLFVNTFRIKWMTCFLKEIGHRPNDLYSNVVYVGAKPSASVSTVNFNSSVDFRLLNPTCEQIRRYLKTNEIFPSTVPHVQGLSNLQNSRNVRCEQFLVVRQAKTDPRRLAEHIWEELRLKFYLSAFSKLEGGGSMYVGVKKIRETGSPSMYVTTHYETSGFKYDSQQRDELKAALIRQIKEDTLVLFFVSEAPPAPLPPECVEIVFHEVSAVRVVLEVAIAAVNGLVFHTKEGPEAYELDEDDKLQRLDVQEWKRRLLME